MNVVDILLIIALFIYIAKGFSAGVIKEAVTFIGGLAVIVIAFLLKNPISVYMYENLPFFNFEGELAGISVFSIVLYELIAFLIVAGILLIIYQIIIKFTNILDLFVKITFIFEIPSKILGAVVGFIEGVVVAFFILFICMQFDLTRTPILESKYGKMILEDTPIISNAASPIYNSLKEIYSVVEQYKDHKNRDEVNLKCFDILLKYKVLDKHNAQILIDNKKLNIQGIEGVMSKYN